MRSFLCLLVLVGGVFLADFLIEASPALALLLAPFLVLVLALTVRLLRG